MAILLPVMVALLFGIIDFSRIFNAEIQLSQAAREAVRLVALSPAYTNNQAMARGELAAPAPAFGRGLADGDFIIEACPDPLPGPPSVPVATVTITYAFDSGIFWRPNLQQKAVMRCSG
jgi:hypothetical protein